MELSLYILLIDIAVPLVLIAVAFGVYKQKISAMEHRMVKIEEDLTKRQDMASDIRERLVAIETSLGHILRKMDI